MNIFIVGFILLTSVFGIISTNTFLNNEKEKQILLENSANSISVYRDSLNNYISSNYSNLITKSFPYEITNQELIDSGFLPEGSKNSVLGNNFQSFVNLNSDGKKIDGVIKLNEIKIQGQSKDYYKKYIINKINSQDIYLFDTIKNQDIYNKFNNLNNKDLILTFGGWQKDENLYANLMDLKTYTSKTPTTNTSSAIKEFNSIQELPNIANAGDIANIIDKGIYIYNGSFWQEQINNKNKILYLNKILYDNNNTFTYYNNKFQMSEGSSYLNFNIIDNKLSNFKKINFIGNGIYNPYNITFLNRGNISSEEIFVYDTKNNGNVCLYNTNNKKNNCSLSGLTNSISLSGIKFEKFYLSENKFILFHYNNNFINFYLVENNSLLKSFTFNAPTFYQVPYPYFNKNNNKIELITTTYSNSKFFITNLSFLFDNINNNIVFNKGEDIIQHNTSGLFGRPLYNETEEYFYIGFYKSSYNSIKGVYETLPELIKYNTISNIVEKTQYNLNDDYLEKLINASGANLKQQSNDYKYHDLIEYGSYLVLNRLSTTHSTIYFINKNTKMIDKIFFNKLLPSFTYSYAVFNNKVNTETNKYTSFWQTSDFKTALIEIDSNLKINGNDFICFYEGSCVYSTTNKYYNPNTTYSTSIPYYYTSSSSLSVNSTIRQFSTEYDISADPNFTGVNSNLKTLGFLPEQFIIENTPPDNLIFFK